MGKDMCDVGMAMNDFNRKMLETEHDYTARDILDLLNQLGTMNYYLLCILNDLVCVERNDPGDQNEQE